MTKNFDSYIAKYTLDERKQMTDVRDIVLSIFPFEETVAYNMPAMKYEGKIVCCFQMHKKHLGFYPYSGSVLQNFSKELEKYEWNKGSVQFPKDKKLPSGLIKKLVKARMKEIKG